MDQSVPWVQVQVLVLVLVLVQMVHGPDVPVRGIISGADGDRRPAAPDPPRRGSCGGRARSTAGRHPASTGPWPSTMWN